MGERMEKLEFADLQIGYRVGKEFRQLLPAVSGTAREGELIALIGKNGIGKSTLLRTIAGLQKSKSGILKIKDRPLKDYTRNQLSSTIGYVSTEIIKVSNMRVFDLVSLGRYPHTNWLGQLSGNDLNSIYHSLEKTGMTGFAERNIIELSDGERQRAMIAMVLAQDAQVLVLDEPTAFLDTSGKFEIIHLLLELSREKRKTIIFSTHDLTTAAGQADKIWLLKDDGLVEGAPEDLMLKGIFTHLFDREIVKFNPYDGTFSIRTKAKGKICIKGDGEFKYWTVRAFQRAGYELDEKSHAFEIYVPANSSKNWVFEAPCIMKEFSTIYEMMDWVREEYSCG